MTPADRNNWPNSTANVLYYADWLDREAKSEHARSMTRSGPERIACVENARAFRLARDFFRRVAAEREPI